MLIDSHCHLDFPDLLDRFEDIRSNMAAHGVTRALCVAVNLEDFPKVLDLVERAPELCASVGVHPDYADVREPDVDTLVRLARPGWTTTGSRLTNSTGSAPDFVPTFRPPALARNR